MDFSRLKAINDEKVQEANSKVSETKKELANLDLQEVFVKSISSLVNFLEGHTTKTVLINQLRDYATSNDSQDVKEAINSLHETLKTHENTDLTPVVDVLKEAVTYLQQIPKDHQEIKIPESKDYSDQLNKFIEVSEAIKTAIESQEVVVEAPVINVEAPNVQVDAPDLKPLGKDLDKSFKKAIDSIVFPESKDYTKVLSDQLLEQRKTNRILEELPTGGSSGSTSIAPFLDETQSLPTNSPLQATRLDNTNDPILYIGKAPVGSNESDSVWQIAKLDTSSGLVKTWAGNAGFNQIWDDRTSLIYI